MGVLHLNVWNSLRMIGTSYFSMLRKFCCEAVCVLNIDLEIFFIINSVSWLVSHLFSLYIPSWFSYERLACSWDLSVSSRLSNCLAYNYLWYPLMIFSYCCDIDSNLSLHFLFCLLVIYLLFSMNLAKDFIILFFLFFKKISFHLIDIFYFRKGESKFY